MPRQDAGDAQWKALMAPRIPASSLPAADLNQSLPSRAWDDKEIKQYCICGFNQRKGGKHMNAKKVAGMIHERTIREVLNKLLAGLDPFEEKQVSREQWHEAGGI
jgi:hypothetical protein